MEESLSEALNIEPVPEMPAPDFVLKDVDGKTVRLHDLKGKVILLNLWATWCPSCRFEMPSMESLHKDYSERGLVVLAVAFQENADAVRSFYQEHELSFPGLLDPTATVFELYQTWSLPTTFVINKRGYIVAKAIGYRDWHSESSKSLFTRLLDESA
jgi:peroxiredoxin